jgi:hypothetical protein
MPEVRYVGDGPTKILLIDLGGITDSGILHDLIGKAIILAQSSGGPGSLLTLLDVTGTRIDRQVIAGLKTLSRSNGRLARATAFVGLGSGWSLLMSALFLIRGKKNHKVIPTRADALAWLQRW